LKIRRQGGDDLSYPMLFVYITGTLLWLAYGLLLHAAAVIWANAATAVLVFSAIVLKATWSPKGRTAREARPAAAIADSSAPSE